MLERIKALARMVLRREEEADEFDVLESTIGAYFTTFVMSTLVQLKIHAQLQSGPLEESVLAERVGAVPSKLSRILHAAKVCGFVELTDEGWQNEPLLDALMDPDSPQAAFVTYFTSEHVVVPFAHMTDVIKGATDVFARANQMSVWEYMETQKDLGDNFEGLLALSSAMEAKIINSTYDFMKSDAVLCDIGGGGGAALEVLLNANPGFKGALLDLPAPIEHAKKRFEGTPLQSRVELISGDMFASIPVTADYYFIKNTLHNWSDDKCVVLMRNIAAAAPAGARLVVCEPEYDKDDLLPGVVWVDLQVMLLCEEGRERSSDEIKTLMRAAGIQPGAVYTYEPSRMVVEGILSGRADLSVPDSSESAGPST